MGVEEKKKGKKKGKKKKEKKKGKKSSEIPPEDTNNVPEAHLESLLSRIDEDDVLLSSLQLPYMAGPDFCDKLAAPMRNNTHLCSIDMTGSALGLAGAVALASAVSTNEGGSLTALNLRGCGIGSDGLGEILAAIRQNISSNITTLLLWGNGLGDEGACALAKMLADSLDDGHKVGSSHSATMGSQATSRTRQACNLIEIDLRMNRVTSAGAISLAQALKVNQTLTSLGLKANGIGNDGAAALAESLQRKENSTLTSLSLMGNPIYGSGKRVLQEAISFDKQHRNNQAITQLDILYGNKPWLLAAARMEVPSKLERLAGHMLSGDEAGQKQSGVASGVGVVGGLPGSRVYNSLAAYYDHTAAPTPIVHALAGRKYVIQD